MTSVARATDYEIIQMTDNDETSQFYMDRYPVINNSGQMTWISCDDSYHWGNCIRMYYDGTTTKEISSPDSRYVTTGGTELCNGEDLLNDAGQVIWSARAEIDNSYNIFLYDGSETIQLTKSGTNVYPVMNSKGQAAWLSSNTVIFYDGAQSKSIGSGWGPRINDLGQIAWRENGTFIWANGTARFYNGTTTISLGAMRSYWPELNDNSQVTWTDDSGILVYDGTSTHIVVETDAGVGTPKINNKGQIAWLEKTEYVTSPNSYYTLYFYDGSSTMKIADNIAPSMMGNVFSLNNEGQLAWIRNNSSRLYENWSAMVYDGVTTTRLHTGVNYDSYVSLSIDMNDRGDVVWGFADDNNDGEIYLAKAASNNPPLFEDIPAQEIFEGEILNFTVSASDLDGDSLTYMASVLPEGAEFDPAGATLTWLTDHSDAGIYTITFTATDDGNPVMSSEIQVEITVIDVPTAPELIVKITDDLTAFDLPKQDMNAYSANLKKVEDLIAQGKNNVAINQLNAFIIKVRQDMDHDDAIGAEGAEYIDLAEDLIVLLENQ
jgi:hypothetical protein